MTCRDKLRVTKSDVRSYDWQRIYTNLDYFMSNASLQFNTLFLLPLNMLTLKMHNYFRKTISRTEIQKPDSKNRNGNNKTKQHKPSSFGYAISITK